MPYLNSVMLMGHLTRDPEIRHTQGGSMVATFGLAASRKSKDREETLFIDVSCWNKLAELVEKSLHKGSAVFVEGSLKLEQWVSAGGEKRQKISVHAENLQFLERRQNIETRGNCGNRNDHAYPQEDEPNYIF